MFKAIHLTVIILFLCTTANSQTVAGKWEGYFVTDFVNGDLVLKDTTYFEVVIKQVNAGKYSCTTYTSKFNYYAAAKADGIFDPATNKFILKETRILEVEQARQSENCFMECDLSYGRAGKKEVLSGSFKGFMVKNRQDCGGGLVYLWKVRVAPKKK